MLEKLSDISLSKKEVKSLVKLVKSNLFVGKTLVKSKLFVGKTFYISLSNKEAKKLVKLVKLVKIVSKVSK